MCDKLLYNIYHNTKQSDSIEYYDTIGNESSFSNDYFSKDTMRNEELDDGVYIMNYNELVDKNNNLIEVCFFFFIYFSFSSLILILSLFMAWVGPSTKHGSQRGIKLILY